MLASFQGMPTLMSRAGAAVDTAEALKAHEGADFFPTWSPDGRNIVFYSDESGYGDLYHMNSDGTGKRRFLRDAGPPS